MARVVVGIATSHSPMLSTPADKWAVHADRDLSLRLLGTDGEYHTYDEVLAQAPPSMKDEITPEKFQSRYDSCQRAIATLGETLATASPDVAVIIGDDQEELFHDDNMPAFSVYWGERIMNIAPNLEKKSLGLRLSSWGYYTETPTEYPGEAALGQHLITQLIGGGFDVAQSRVQQSGIGMSHAFTFVHRRIMKTIIPVVPVFINTYYPPNQPTIRRCYAFGEALRRAIESWKADARVAVIASGGLSHFVVDEKLDRSLLTALSRRDQKSIVSLPEARLRSGNSELKNWAALGATVEHLEMQLLDYVPVYRSPAGTGCAMAFARWA